MSFFAGSFLFQAPYATEALLTAAYPDGSYTAQVTHGGGTASRAVALGAAPTLPRCANHAEAQVIDPAAAFILRWDALANAGPNDQISVEIRDGDTTLLRLPDECSLPPKPLSSSATSATIPAGLLQPGRTYQASLTFIKGSDRQQNTNPDFVVYGGYARTTDFTIQTIGGGGNLIPVIDAYRVANDGRFEVDVTASPGRTLTLEATGSLGGAWTDVGSALVPAGGKVTVRDSRLATQEFQGFRVRSQ